MPRFRRRSPFGRARTPVTQSTVLMAKRRKCKACGVMIAAGESAVRLRLKKSYRSPCAGCGHKRVGMKVFHPKCLPLDINKAMGYDASQHVHATPPAATVAPPPKPPSADDAALAALGALEHALVLRLKNTPSAWCMRPDKNGQMKRQLTLEYEKAFNTIQGLKSRALRPGTPAEGETATSILLQRLVKLVYA